MLQIHHFTARRFQPYAPPLSGSLASDPKMAAACASSNTLDLLPEDLSLACFGEIKLTQRCKRQGYRFFVQGYMHKISVSAHHGEVVAKANCFRSMRKSEAPHALQVCFDRASGLISLSKCSCKAG